MESMQRFNPNMKQDNVTNVCFDDPTFYSHYSDKNHKNNKDINAFMLALALCHTVIFEVKNEKPVYNASSPDELALVQAAKFFGYAFAGRDEDSNMLIRLPNG